MAKPSTAPPAGAGPRDVQPPAAGAVQHHAPGQVIKAGSLCPLDGTSDKASRDDRED